MTKTNDFFDWVSRIQIKQLKWLLTFSNIFMVQLLYYVNCVDLSDFVQACILGVFGIFKGCVWMVVWNLMFLWENLLNFYSTIQKKSMEN